MKGIARQYQELRRENPVKVRQFEAYTLNTMNPVKLPQIVLKRRQQSLGARPDFVLDCNQSTSRLSSYDTLRDKYLKGYYINKKVQRAMKKTGIIDKQGKVIDFFAKPIHRIPIKEIFEPYHLKRNSSRLLNTNRSEINLSRHDSYQRLSAGDSSDRSNRSGQQLNRIRLKPLSNDELQRIIQKHKQKINKDSNVETATSKVNGQDNSQDAEHNKSKKESQTNEKVDEKEPQPEDKSNQQKVEEKEENQGLFITQN